MMHFIFQPRKRTALLLTAGLLSLSGQMMARPSVTIVNTSGIVALTAQKTTIQDVFTYIERHSSYVFAFDKDVRSRLGDEVSLSLKGKSMETIIAELCRKQVWTMLFQVGRCLSRMVLLPRKTLKQKRAIYGE